MSRGRRASLPGYALPGPRSTSCRDPFHEQRCRDCRRTRGHRGFGCVFRHRAALEQAPRGNTVTRVSAGCLRLDDLPAALTLFVARSETKLDRSRAGVVAGGRPERAVWLTFSRGMWRAPPVAAPRAGAAGGGASRPRRSSSRSSTARLASARSSAPAPRPLRLGPGRELPSWPRPARRRAPRAHPGAVPRDGRGARRSRPLRRLRGPRAAPPHDRSTGRAATPSARSPSGGAPRPGGAPRAAARTPPARRRGRPS